MLFTIKDIENLSGIKAHTIRIWEQRYSFLKPKRSDTNIRYYTADELKIILNISILCKYGYKVSQINNMSHEAMQSQVQLLSGSNATEDISVNSLLESMIALNLTQFENILNNYIAHSGIENTVSHLIFPFLDKVGMLWLASNVNPIQERLVSNIIRQKIITGINTLPSVKSKTAGVCLFLPEDEYHELSLLFVDFMLKKKGISTLYLGPNLSMQELKAIVNLKKPKTLYTHITHGGNGFDFDHFIKDIKKQFPSISIIISGRHARFFEKKIPPKIFLKKSLAEVKEHLTNL